MIVDLHAHYPMESLARFRRLTLLGVATLTARRIKHHRPTFRSVVVPGDGYAARQRRRAPPFLRWLFLWTLNALFNRRSPFSAGAVTIQSMRAGGVGVALSVLIEPLDEIEGHGESPYPEYFHHILAQLQRVERDIPPAHREHAVFVHNYDELEAARRAHRLALIHCIEGGFSLGSGGPNEIDCKVAELGCRGVAYITLAHLVYRGVATNNPAIPPISDSLYKRLFRQPEEGLSELGRAAVSAMARHGILIDIAHMTERAVDETVAVLDKISPNERVPVLASHIACRFGAREYCLSEHVIKTVAQRDGVLGVIFCDHWMRDGLLPRRTRSIEESLKLIYDHICRIHAVTGSYRHVALGSDLDGFIKPALRGLEVMDHMTKLEAALRERYGTVEAERITSGNALRVLKAAWRPRRVP